MQRVLNKNQNAYVALEALVPPNGAQEINHEQAFQMKVTYLVTQNTAKNMREFSILQIEDSPPNGVNDKNVWAKFKGVAAEKIADRGQDRVAGTRDWSTLEKRMDRTASASIIAGTKTLYVMGIVQWTNPSGADGHLDVCLWLQKPKTKIITPTSAWHNCSF